jgi:hypothetical protein
LKGRKARAEKARLEREAAEQAKADRLAEERAQAERARLEKEREKARKKDKDEPLRGREQEHVDWVTNLVNISHDPALDSRPGSDQR